MKNVVFYGTGSLAREIYDLNSTSNNPNISFVGYINDSGNDLSFEALTGITRSFLGDHVKGLEYLICVADPLIRQDILNKIHQVGGCLFTYIHPTALISNSSVISEGCIIYPYVVVSANARVGRAVILNTYSGIGHDVEINECCTISAHVDLAGYVKVDRCCFFGSGARVVPRKKIGRNSKIGAGVTVIRSLKEGSTILPLANKIYI